MARRGVRKARNGIVLLVLLVVIGGGGYAGWVLVKRSDPVSLPTPTGQFQVGRQTFEWTDSARRDPYVAGPRKLAVWVWYPVAKGVTGRKAAYAPAQWSEQQLKAPWSILEGSMDEVRDHALDHAALAPGRFPVVVLLPGMGLSASMYSALAEDLASHGYLVAGVTPTYSTELTVLGGQTVRSMPAAVPPAPCDNSPGGLQTGDHLVGVWAADARFAAQQVGAEFPDSIDPAFGPSYVGHSFGGASALEACRTDARCAAAVDIDGRQFGDAVKKGVQAPILLLGADDSCITSVCGPDAKSDADRARALSLLKASTNTSWCATIPDTRHLNFTDYGVYHLSWPLPRHLGLGTADRRRALTIQNGYVSTFLSHALRNTPAPGAPACAS